MPSGKKFAVSYASEEDVEKLVVANAPNPHVNRIPQMILELLRTDRWCYKEANLNKIFPEIRPMGVEAFLELWWGRHDVYAVV